MADIRLADETVIDGWNSIDDFAVDDDRFIWAVSSSAEDKMIVLNSKLDHVNACKARNLKLENPVSVHVNGRRLYVGDDGSVPRVSCFYGKKGGQDRDYPGINAKRISSGANDTYALDVAEGRDQMLRIYGKVQGKNQFPVMSGVDDIASYGGEVYALHHTRGRRDMIVSQATPYVNSVMYIPSSDVKAFAMAGHDTALVIPQTGKSRSKIHAYAPGRAKPEILDPGMDVIDRMVFEPQGELLIAGRVKKKAKIMRFEYRD